jgi:hypothetical protein
MVYKDRIDAVVPSKRSAAVASAELPWQEWVSDFVYACLAEFAEDTGKQTIQWLEKIWRELELLQREFTILQNEVGLERGLRDLRSEVEQARSEVPKLPAIAQRLEEGQARLVGEIERTKAKLSKLRVDQSIAAHRLAELTKTAAARSKAMELKVERTERTVASFEMEIHPGAAEALRSFADATLGTRDEKIWILPGGPTAGAA